MKKIKLCVQLLCFCLCFSSCEKDDLVPPIKDIWNNDHGIEVSLNGKNVTLPPNGEVWMWITETLANELIKNDVEITKVRTNQVAAHKLYKDKNGYVLSIQLADTTEFIFHNSDYSANAYLFETAEPFEHYYNKKVYTYGRNINYGVKAISFPLNTKDIVLKQVLQSPEEENDFIEHVYFGNTVNNLDIELHSLRDVEIPSDGQGSIVLKSKQFSQESLEIPEGWTVSDIELENLKSLKIKGSLDGRISCPSLKYLELNNDVFNASISCPKLEDFALNDNIEYLTETIINCPTLSDLTLPESLKSLDISMECPIETLTIPINVEMLWADLTQCEQLSTMYFKPLKCPYIHDELGLGDRTITIYIPEASYYNYQNNDDFRNFSLGHNVLTY